MDPFFSSGTTVLQSDMVRANGCRGKHVDMFGLPILEWRGIGHRLTETSSFIAPGVFVRGPEDGEKKAPAESPQNPHREKGWAATLEKLKRSPLIEG
jgi:hypothetical protein